MTEQIRIVIAEDHLATQEGLMIGLSREPDMKVLGVASTSNEGIAMVKSMKPDVAVFDLHLPGSFAPREMIRECLSAANVKVIVFSGESRRAFIQAIVKQGVSAYLLKTETVEKVAETIRRVSRGSGEPILSKQLDTSKAKLTRAEEEVLAMLARGMKYQNIAGRRMSSPETVRKQCELLQVKLGLDSREELISWAARSGYAEFEIEGDLLSQ